MSEVLHAGVPKVSMQRPCASAASGAPAAAAPSVLRTLRREMVRSSSRLTGFAFMRAEFTTVRFCAVLAQERSLCLLIDKSFLNNLHRQPSVCLTLLYMWIRYRHWLIL